ncbi:hypothetical protein [Paraburkholderia sediminicola]|uniref:hypothetical protein n=1 Tax=Paraburkholderia sediminicola TaxID=458836 RepID=UPI0038BE0A4F
MEAKDAWKERSTTANGSGASPLPQPVQAAWRTMQRARVGLERFPRRHAPPSFPNPAEIMPEIITMSALERFHCTDTQTDDSSVDS